MKQTILVFLALWVPLMVFSQDPVFIDGSNEAGISGTSSNYCAAIVDVDQDGLEDIYVGSKLTQPNKMYRNNGDGTFSNIASQLGLESGRTTHAAIWADFDNDGDPDCYLGNYNQNNEYYRNEGNGVFVEVAEELGISGDFGNTRCVVSADVNEDGFLDIYVVNLNENNEFYLGDGNGGFINHYWLSGATEVKIGLGAVFFDSDNDGDQDLYIAHDAYQANSMYINNGNGYFTEQAAQLGINNAGQGMGVDVTDFNHDGWMDIYITNYHDGNTLYVNDGDGTYTEISVEAGVDDIGQGWGISWTDYDADGDKDIYLANNNSFASVPNVLYRNNGDSTFTIVSTGTVLESPFIGAAIASADLNLDGTEDIVVCNNLVNESPGAQLFWNETTGNNWIGLELEGVVSNKNAIGAVVTLYAEELVQKDVVLGGSGYSQMNSFKLNFGLGQHESVDMIEIQWPNGLREFFYDFDVNQYHSITEGTGAGPSADFNLDGVVGMADLLMLLPKLQSTDPYFDLSEDGQVGTSDLLYFLQEYGH